ncbi:hypothetical protein PSHT_00674 [Puccinia striiformis]|uniref:Uncharacterized protein n=1 Tax=Puccinia striiformis TaxID=27350 RepID=A0A2S4WMG0_9BASI|nr:hypothetical protein PSHT_00674 [Puccinia striiformis]
MPAYTETAGDGVANLRPRAIVPPCSRLDTVEITVHVNPRSATPGPIVNMAGVAYSSAVENTIAKGDFVFLLNSAKFID